MSSLPQSWHGIGQSPSKPINTVSPLKRPKTLKISPLNSSKEITQPERLTWNQRPTFDPSTIECASTSGQSNTSPSTTILKTQNQTTDRTTRNQRPTKPTMPVSTITSNKFRAKALGNGSELKSRMQEEINAEISSLRKELSHAREEITALKGKLRRTDDDSTKKIKQLEKQLSSSKKDYLSADKKKEAAEEIITNLKKKCQQLEVEMRTKDTAMRKMQSSLKSPPRSADRATIANRRQTPPSSALLNSSTRALQISRQASNKNTGPSPETLRLREANKQLLQDVAKFQQQLKEKEQEIRTLKVSLNRNQKNTTSAPSRLSSTNSNNKDVLPSKVSTNKPPQRLSRSTLHRSPMTTKRPTNIKETNKLKPSCIINKVINDIPENNTTEVSEPQRATADDKNTSIQELQRKAAARKIQRGWRNHRERVTKENKNVEGEIEKQVLTIRSAHEVLISEEPKELLEEDIEYLQSVLKGHLTRTDHAAAFQNIDLSDEMSTTIEEIHQNCLENSEKDGAFQIQE